MIGGNKETPKTALVIGMVVFLFYGCAAKDLAPVQSSELQTAYQRAVADILRIFSGPVRTLKSPIMRRNWNFPDPRALLKLPMSILPGLMNGKVRPTPGTDIRGPAWDIPTIGATRPARLG